MPFVWEKFVDVKNCPELRENSAWKWTFELDSREIHPTAHLLVSYGNRREQEGADVTFVTPTVTIIRSLIDIRNDGSYSVVNTDHILVKNITRTTHDPLYFECSVKVDSEEPKLKWKLPNTASWSPVISENYCHSYLIPERFEPSTRTHCWNVNHCQQQSYSGLCSPKLSFFTFLSNLMS